MQKMTAVLLAFVLAFSLASCTGGEPTDRASVGANASTSAESVSAATESKETENDEGEQKVLVAYFSATGTTKGVAQQIADGLSCDLYEITPQDPYTDADLNYSDTSSRTTSEMNDENARPAISGAVSNMAQYDVVFLGYPIWWGEAPRIISTFLESYDFTGKTIVPFCTSGSSGISSSVSSLKPLTSGATWLEGQRFGGGVSDETVTEWVRSLNLAPDTQ